MGRSTTGAAACAAVGSRLHACVCCLPQARCRHPPRFTAPEKQPSLACSAATDAVAARAAPPTLPPLPTRREPPSSASLPFLSSASHLSNHTENIPPPVPHCSQVRQCRPSHSSHPHPHWRRHPLHPLWCVCVHTCGGLGRCGQALARCTVLVLMPACAHMPVSVKFRMCRRLLLHLLLRPQAVCYPFQIRNYALLNLTSPISTHPSTYLPDHPPTLQTHAPSGSTSPLPPMARSAWPRLHGAPCCPQGCTSSASCPTRGFPARRQKYPSRDPSMIDPVTPDIMLAGSGGKAHLLLPVLLCRRCMWYRCATAAPPPPLLPRTQQGPPWAFMLLHRLSKRPCTCSPTSPRPASLLGGGPWPAGRRCRNNGSAAMAMACTAPK